MEDIRPKYEEPVVALLLLEGNLVRHEDLALEGLMQELIEREYLRFILDFSKVEFVDSAGIGLIIKLASMADKNKGILILCNPQKNVKNVFSMLGIESRFKIHSRLSEAMMTFGRLLRIELISIKF